VIARIAVIAFAGVIGIAHVGGVQAADVVVTATMEPQAIRIGEFADLNVVVQGRQSTKRPTLDDVADLSVQYVGPSSQVSIVNGRMSSSVTHRFVVSSSRVGRYEIGPIRVDVDGDVKDAGRVALEVRSASAPPSAQAPPGTGELELTMSVKRNEVYLHERVPIRLVLRIGAVRVDNLQYPVVQGEGFALEDFAEPKQKRQQGARGAEHLVEFEAYLKPLRQGPLALGPATMGMSIVVPRSRRGSGSGFGSLFGEELRPVQVAADAITLDVLPLPEVGRPAGFSGAVGRFKMDVSIAPREVKVGDPITVTTRLRGDGLLEGLVSPAIPASEMLRVYPVQSPRADQDGGRTFEQVVIPLAEGPLALTGPAFSYFDPEAREYKTLSSAPVAIAVKPSANADDRPRIVGGLPRSETAPDLPLGRDLVFIKDAPGTLAPIGGRRATRGTFWLFQLLPLALWLGASAYEGRRRRMTGDTRYARFTRAGRKAREEIALARQALAGGELAECHDRAAGALREYLAAKLDLAPGAVDEAAPTRLAASGVESEVVEEVRGFIASSADARFAPGRLSRAELEKTLDRADALLRHLERTRNTRKLRQASTAALVAGLTFAAAMTAQAAAMAAQAATSDDKNPSALFFSANALYSDERYAEAAATYESVLASGVESGTVHYNLGNAYFKAGSLGQAVLAYERARRLIPGDPDLAANRAFAREQADDVQSQSLLERIAFPLAERMSTDSLLLLAAAVWWALLFALAGAALLPRVEKPARRVALAFSLLLVLVVASAAYRHRTVDHPRFAVVTSSEEATVRYEPSPNGTAFYNVKPGAVLRVVGDREGWRQVSTRDGRRGWVEAAALSTL
jgi:tetratricopeptide (TPR) repeat protein